MFAKLRLFLSALGLLALLVACSPAAPIDFTTTPPLEVVESTATPEVSPSTEPSLAPPSFDCSNIQQVSIEECEGLVALYEATNGDQWGDPSGWLVTQTPCSWYGVTCQQGHIVDLQLFYNDLSGSLPPEIGNLTHLKNLYLDGNQLGGPLPAEIGNLSELQLARLGDNQFGSIPAEIANLNNLVYLELWGNELSGEIPAELSQLSNLQELNLGFNQFTGSIPPELGNLMFLHKLYLSHNQLSGSIPEALGNLTNLNELDLSFNRLTGPIPAGLADLSHIYLLDLSYNQFTGTVPAAILNGSTFERRLWGNQFEGTVMASEGTTIPVEYQGVQFEFSADLASSVWPETVPTEEGTADAPGWLVWPEHSRFTFAYPRGAVYVSRFAAAFGPARIMIYPTETYAEMSEFAKTEIEELRTLLETRPGVIENEMPALPLINAAQVFHAQVEYLDFQNGQGVRFISQYSQDISPIFNQSLFYTFQGLTEDGAYYVAAFFPLSAEGLSDEPTMEDWDAFSAQYQDYLKETVSQLDAFSPDQFDPDLRTLDAVIGSLAVNPP